MLLNYVPVGTSGRLSPIQMANIEIIPPVQTTEVHNGIKVPKPSIPQSRRPSLRILIHLRDWGDSNRPQFDLPCKHRIWRSAAILNGDQREIC